jgi:hypothetical protein
MGFFASTFGAGFGVAFFGAVLAVFGAGFFTFFVAVFMSSLLQSQGVVMAGTTSQPLVIGRYSGGQTCAPRRAIASQNRLQSWPVFTRLSASASFTAAAMSAGAIRAFLTSKPRASPIATSSPAM